jgi:hypothetical protein
MWSSAATFPAKAVVVKSAASVNFLNIDYSSDFKIYFLFNFQ